MGKATSKRKVPEASPGERIHELQVELQGLPGARRDAIMAGDRRRYRELCTRETVVRDEISFLVVLMLRGEGERLDRAMVEVLGEREGIIWGMDELRAGVAEAERSYLSKRRALDRAIGEVRQAEATIARIRSEREAVGSALDHALAPDPVPAVAVPDDSKRLVLLSGSISSGPRPGTE